MEYNRFNLYLKTIEKPFRKLSKIEFLQPDDSVAFSVSNTYKRGYSSKYDSRAFLQDGSLSISMKNGARRSASITLANVDDAFLYSVNKIWFGSRVRLSMGCILPDGTEFYLPQGVFYLADPNNNISPSSKTISYSLKDKWSYLDGSLFGTLPNSYTVRENTDVFFAMQNVLWFSKRNMTEIATDKFLMLDATPPVFPVYYNDKVVNYTIVNPDGTQTPKTTTKNMTAFSTTVEMGKTAADILLGLNKNLVGLIGYDQTGALRVEPSQYDILDIEKPVLHTFSPSNSIFLGQDESINVSEVFNNVIAVGEGLRSSTVYAIATNQDPSSDTNANLIGLKTYKENNSELWNNEQCADYADYILKQKTVLRKSVTIRSAQMFHLYENALIAIKRTDKEGSPVENHLIQSINIPIGETGSMTIKAVSVNDYPISTITLPPDPPESNLDP